MNIPRDIIRIPEHIVGLKPYKAGKHIERIKEQKKLSNVVKLASNENPLGPSPKAIEAIEKSLKSASRYPDPQATLLIRAISKKYGLDKNNIVCGSGTDSLLAYVISAFTESKDQILTSEGTFIGTYVSTLKLGRQLQLVPLNDYHYDLKAILKNITPSTKIIYLANPNNPTGLMFEKQEFEDFMKQVPTNILVILDEAYELYVGDNKTYPNGIHYEYENLIVTRTFSKAYGLAGFRVGWACGPKKLIEQIYKVKLPFEPSQIAQLAAVAALNDDAFLKQTKETNQKSLALFREKFKRLGIKYLDSAANFLLLIFHNEKKAASFTQQCLDKGLILRHVTGFGILNAVRINSGTIDESLFAIKIIEEVYKKL